MQDITDDERSDRPTTKSIDQNVGKVTEMARTKPEETIWLIRARYFKLKNAWRYGTKKTSAVYKRRGKRFIRIVDKITGRNQI